jgi:DNA replication protein DnaC
MSEMTLDVVRGKLEKIGLKYTADNLSFLLEEAVKEDMSLHTFLDQVLTEELQRREEERIKMWLRLSSLPPGKTLENFDFSFQPSISKKRIEMLATSEYVRRCENILFLGPPGVGKSHLAAGLGVRAIECGFRVLYRRLDDLIRMLSEDAIRPRARVNRRSYHRARLLIIDEVGFDTLSATEANLFFHLISRRLRELLSDHYQ